MKKFIFYPIVIFLCNISYSQFPEAKEYSINYDSIKKTYIYYEKFENRDERKLLNNKIIKSPKKTFIISEGLIIQEIEVLKDVDNIECIFIKYDSLKNIKNKVYCEEKRLKKVELYDSGKLTIIYEYGKFAATANITKYEYFDWGYYEYYTYNNQLKKYEVKNKEKSRKLIESIKILSESDILKDKNNQYYWAGKKSEESVIFDEYCKICNPITKPK